MIFSEVPLSSVTFDQDLTRLSLAQASRLILSVARPLTTAQREAFEFQTFSLPPNIPLSARLKALTPDVWQIHGLPW
jgi:hypothetical protein